MMRNPAQVFTNATLIWGLGLALVPVLIHLLLRARPRRVRFPALVLMRAVLVSGQRSRRAQNLLLLAVRALVLCAAALLLAGPTCTPTGADAGGPGPRAAVVVLDDSLSLSYRPQYTGSETLLDRAAGQARALAEEFRTWPAGSAFALLRAGAPENSVLSSGPASITATLAEQGTPGPHARPLGAAVEAAARLLRTAPQSERRLIVVTDGAASAWRDVRAGMLAGITGLHVRVVTVRREDPANFALVAAEAPNRLWPESARVPLHVQVRATGLTGEVHLVVRREQDVVARAGPLPIAAGALKSVTLELPPTPAGAHAATVELEPPDLLDFDQRRYVAWQTAPTPEAWIVAPHDLQAGGDVSLLLLTNLLSPELLPAEQQRVRVRTLDPAQVPAAAAEPAHARPHADPLLLVVFPAADSPPAAAATLVRLVEGGATALLVPASRAAAPDWPALRAVLSDALPVEQALERGVNLRWETGPPLPAGAAELAQCAVYRRLRLAGVLPEARVEATYDDGVPAIVSRRVGRGRVVILTTSPDPEWSALGVRAAGLLSWLYALVDEAAGPPQAITALTAGDAARTVFPVLPDGELVRLARVEPEGPATWLRLPTGGQPQPWPADAAGIYAVRGADGRNLVRYAVNWPAEESDLAPIERPALVRLLGTDHVALDAPDAGPGNPAKWPGRLRSWTEPARWLGLLLLALFLAEAVLAARGAGRELPA